MAAMYFGEENLNVSEREIGSVLVMSENTERAKVDAQQFELTAERQKQAVVCNENKRQIN